MIKKIKVRAPKRILINGYRRCTAIKGSIIYNDFVPITKAPRILATVPQRPVKIQHEVTFSSDAPRFPRTSRGFFPCLNGVPLTPKDIVTYDPSAAMSSIRTDQGIPWVIAIDGGCRHRKGKSISSYGIFFGPESPYNRYARVPKGLPQTIDGAEYHAAREAIDIAMQQISKYASNKVEEIVIQSDSDSVVAGLTEYVWRWQINGWRTKHGHPIESTQIIKDLHILVHKAAIEYGVRIKFWKVPRQYNADADNLATLGLDEDEEAYKARHRQQTRRDCTASPLLILEELEPKEARPNIDEAVTRVQTTQEKQKGQPLQEKWIDLQSQLTSGHVRKSFWPRKANLRHGVQRKVEDYSMDKSFRSSAKYTHQNRSIEQNPDFEPKNHHKSTSIPLEIDSSGRRRSC